MGQVFLGVSPGGRPVAVKAIRPELASDPQFRVRFAREVAAARTVSGMFTAMVVGADVDGPMAWLATAYVPGPSLAEAVDEHGPLPEGSLLALAGGLAEALAAIHAAGVTHRDLKPSNVLLAEDGPRVIDFGISRAAESTGLTQTGMTIGSPGFMSPEQAVGTEVGPPSDIFSLGAVLAYSATGKGPFGGGTTASLLYRVVHETPDLDGVPASLRPLIEHCLVKDPAQRPTAAAALDAVGALQPAGNWLPESLTRMVAAASAPSGPVPTAMSAPPQTPPRTRPETPPQTPSPVPPTVPVPGLAVTQTSLAGAAAGPPYQATELWSTPADGQPPLIPAGPPPGTGEPPRRRRSRGLVLAAVIGVLVLGGAGAAFALSSHGHTATPAQSPAAQISSATSTRASASASATATARKHQKATASASSAHTGAVTQPASTFSATHATTSPTHTTTTTTTSPTATTTTSPTPTTTSPTPTTQPSPTATTSTSSAPPTSYSPPASASS